MQTSRADSRAGNSSQGLEQSLQQLINGQATERARGFVHPAGRLSRHPAGCLPSALRDQPERLAQPVHEGPLGVRQGRRELHLYDKKINKKKERGGVAPAVPSPPRSPPRTFLVPVTEPLQGRADGDLHLLVHADILQRPAAPAARRGAPLRAAGLPGEAAAAPTATGSGSAGPGHGCEHRGERLRGDRHRDRARGGRGQRRDGSARGGAAAGSSRRGAAVGDR